MEEGFHAGGDRNAPLPSVQFGPFEVNLQRRELRKDGRRVRLQEQPFQILRMLLESPGEVVSREDIRKRLWPEGTVVEFDHSINAAVKRLRDALRDSADKPRYIETSARRGYRSGPYAATSRCELWPRWGQAALCRTQPIPVSAIRKRKPRCYAASSR